VNDSKDEIFIFRNAVNDTGLSLEVLEVTTAIAALRHLRSAEKLPDFIFLDENLPGMTGIECLKEIKLDEKLRHIPVIMYMCFKPNPRTVQDAMENGAAYFLVKPDNIDELPAGIIKALGAGWEEIDSGS
jgi:CheY-like chemotaxis protein